MPEVDSFVGWEDVNPRINVWVKFPQAEPARSVINNKRDLLRCTQIEYEISTNWLPWLCLTDSTNNLPSLEKHFPVRSEINPKNLFQTVNHPDAGRPPCHASTRNTTSSPAYIPSGE